jgi:TonB family protein
LNAVDLETENAFQVSFTPLNQLEEKPQPKGGMEVFYEYVQANLKYPRKAKKENIEGKVSVKFTITQEGIIQNVEVVEGLHPDCDAEAVRVLQNAPAWMPAQQRNKNVEVEMTLPIVFKLNEPDLAKKNHPTMGINMGAIGKKRFQFQSLKKIFPKEKIPFLNRHEGSDAEVK